jgi:glutathione S-transferase
MSSPPAADIALIARAVLQLGRRLRAARPSPSVTPSALGLLSTLHQRGPMPAVELARAEGLQPQSLTRLIARLEADGLIARSPGEEDLRTLIIVITAEGRRALKRDLQARRAWLGKAIEARLDASERDRLLFAAPLMLKLAEETAEAAPVTAETPEDAPAPEPDITLYFAPASRAFTPRWLLEELGLPYRVKKLNLRRGDQKTAGFRRINPLGKVPALTDGETAVAENPAICLYLADRYSYGALAPRIEDPRRAAYLRWMVFSTAVFEPSVYSPDEAQDPISAGGRGWGQRAAMIETLDQALSRGPWLLGERFSACDVMLGSLLSIVLFNRRLADPPATFLAYNARLEARPAYKRAALATWPPAPEAASR